MFSELVAEGNLFSSSILSAQLVRRSDAEHQSCFTSVAKLPPDLHVSCGL